MATTTKLFIVMLIVTISSSMAFAQEHEMFLPKPTEATYINQIVNGDVDGSGNRLDPDRVYVLERGGTWFFNGKIENIGWALRMKASDGDGPRPVIYNVVNQNGSLTGDMIQGKGNVYLQNLTINGLADYDPNAYDEQGFAGIIVIMRSPGFDLELDGCVIANSGSALLRTVAATRKISITNCIFANYGQLPKKSMGNGRVLDLRDVSCDSLIMVNNTMLNGYDRVLRHGASTGALNNLIFEHNTVINNAGRFGTLGLGLVGESVRVTNNMFVDPMALGADTNSTRQPDFREMGEAYDDGKMKMTWIYHQKEETPTYDTQWTVKNNYWCVTPDLQAAFDQIKSTWNPALEGIGRPLSDYIADKVGGIEAAFTNENITFTNSPNDMADMVIWNHKPIAEGGAGGKDSGSNYVEYDKRKGVYYADTLDCSYATSLAAYTGALGGFPVGDLNWFPDKKKEWENAGGIFVNVESKDFATVPVQFSLHQNYPNPFNPTTKISFKLNEAGFTTLSVFNMLGQKVATPVAKKLSVGCHEINFDASLLANGIYFYRLESGNNISMKKMILLK